MLTHLLLLMVFAAWYYLGCMDANYKKVNIRETLSIKCVSIVLLVAVGMCLFVNFAMPIVMLVIPENIVHGYEALMEKAGFGDSIAPTITSILVAPFSEELMFRGVFFYYLKKGVEGLPNRRVAFGLANCVQALLFGIFHMNIIQGGYAFVIGLSLGYLSHRFKSVLPAILAHMINNLLSIFVWGHIVNALPESYTVYAVCAGIALLVAVIGYVLSDGAEKQAELKSNVNRKGE